MKILLDTTPLMNGNSGRGVGTYTRELLSALKELSKEKSFEVIATHEEKKSKNIDETSFDVIHYPYFDLFFSTLPFPRKTPIIVTVHDVIPLVFSQNYPPGIKGKLRFFWQRWKLQQVSAVLTDSKVSQADIIEYLGISEHKVHVVPLAANAQMVPQSEYYQSKYTAAFNLPEKYIVYIGDINFNKNLPTLLLALTEIPDVYLVVINKAFQNTAIPEGRRLAEIVRENNLTERILFPNVPYGEPEVLASILQGSRCLVQPSLYEGFGLPVLEALQSGAIVVSTNGGSLPEVAGDAAILVEPTISGLQKGIREALHLRGGEREARIAKGIAWAKHFSWQKAARETYAVYESVLQEKI